MLCPFCGREISANAKFCRHCGKKIEQGIEAAVPVIQPDLPQDTPPPNTIIQEPSIPKTENAQWSIVYEKVAAQPEFPMPTEAAEPLPTEETPIISEPQKMEEPPVSSEPIVVEGPPKADTPGFAQSLENKEEFRCDNCGASISKMALFCGACGQKIEGAVESPKIKEAAIEITDVKAPVTKPQEKKIVKSKSPKQTEAEKKASGARRSARLLPLLVLCICVPALIAGVLYFGRNYLPEWMYPSAKPAEIELTSAEMPEELRTDLTPGESPEPAIVKNVEDSENENESIESEEEEQPSETSIERVWYQEYAAALMRINPDLFAICELTGDDIPEMVIWNNDCFVCTFDGEGVVTLGYMDAEATLYASPEGTGVNALIEDADGSAYLLHYESEKWTIRDNVSQLSRFSSPGAVNYYMRGGKFIPSPEYSACRDYYTAPGAELVRYEYKHDLWDADALRTHISEPVFGEQPMPYVDKGTYYDDPRPESGYETSSANYTTGVTRGNTTGNIINGGILARYPAASGNIFFAAHPSGGVSVYAGNAESLVLEGVTVRSMNVAHDALFFIDASTDALCRISISDVLAGRQPQTLIEDRQIHMISILGNSIYAIEKDGSLVAYNLSGNRRLLTETPAKCLAAWGNYIYFVGWDGSLRRITPGQENERILVKGGVSVFDIYADGLFYNNELEGGVVCSVGFYGQKVSRVALYPAREVNSNEGVLYFIHDQEGVLSSVNYQGANYKVLDGPNISNLSQSQNKLCYVKDGELYSFDIKTGISRKGWMGN